MCATLSSPAQNGAWRICATASAGMPELVMNSATASPGRPAATCSATPAASSWDGSILPSSSVNGGS